MELHRGWPAGVGVSGRERSRHGRFAAQGHPFQALQFSVSALASSLTPLLPCPPNPALPSQVALTVMRIQRKWRETAARRKTEREAARPVVPPLRLGSIPGLSGRR